MHHTRNDREHEDLYLVRTRIAEDRTRAQRENLATRAARERRGAGARVWVGRRLVAIGAVLAGDARPPAATADPGGNC
jgi:hypothetical protein